MIITIDGPAGAGKSTVARELTRLGQPGSFDDVLAQITDRDQRDRTRSVAPLV